MLIRLCYADHEELSNACNSRDVPSEHNYSIIGGKMKRRTSTPDTEPQITRDVQDLTEQIRQRAYELYELRDRADGHELDDWLLAESQLTQKREATDSQELRSPDRAHELNDAIRWAAPSLDRAATSSWGSCCLLCVTFVDVTAGSD